MDKKKAYLFLRVPDRNTSKSIIRKMVEEMELFASQHYEILKTVVKLGNTRFSSDAVDPDFLKEIKESGCDMLIVRSFSSLSTRDIELRVLYSNLNEDNICCLSMIDQADLCSYLYYQNSYKGLLQYE